MSSLSSLAVQQARLEDIINIGLDSLPSSNDFLSSLAKKISPQIVDHYKIIGWDKFRSDLIFLLEHEGESLDYANISLYWSRWDDGYLLLSAEMDDTAANHFYYETLDEVLGQIFDSLIELQEDPRSGMAIEDDLIDPVQRQVLEFMVEKNQDDVDKIFDHLEKGGLIELNKAMNEFSIFPLNESVSARMVLDENKLVIVGLFQGGMIEEVDPEFNTPSDSYVIQYSREDAKLILAILIYNRDAYRLI
jgi:hypothetical protein